MSKTQTQISTPSSNPSQKERKLDGWREVKLGEFATIKGGKRLPKGKLLSKIVTKHPYIRITDFDGHRINLSNIEYVDEQTQSVISKYTVDYEDLIISIVGTIGLCAIVPRLLNKANLTENCAKINFDKSRIDSEFLYYQLTSDDIQCKIQGLNVGSTQPKLPLYNIKKIPLLLPSLPEQKAIAEVLSSLDDKIDLLHRQNKTLEDMAQALFRKWFIEEAKEDWEEKSLDEVADYLNGLACQKYPPENEIDKLPVLKIKELRNGFTENSDWATSKVDEKYIVELGDVIFSWSGSLMLKIWGGQKCVLNQHLFKVTSEKYPKWLYYFWTKHHLEKFIGIADSKATTMGHIKRGDLSNSLVRVPRTDELLKMSERILPEFEKMILNYNQIANLEQQRDVLLPKLMSGAVRVKF